MLLFHKLSFLLSMSILLLSNTSMRRMFCQFVSHDNLQDVFPLPRTCLWSPSLSPLKFVFTDVLSLDYQFLFQGFHFHCNWAMKQLMLCSRAPRRYQLSWSLCVRLWQCLYISLAVCLLISCNKKRFHAVHITNVALNGMILRFFILFGVPDTNFQKNMVAQTKTSR